MRTTPPPTNIYFIIKTCADQHQNDIYLSNGRGVWKRDARFGAGLEGSFSSFGETSLVVLTHRRQMGNGGEAAEGA